MTRILGLFLLALGSGLFLGRFAFDGGDDGMAPVASPSPFATDATAARGGNGEAAASMVNSLASLIDAEVAERRRLEQRIEALAAEVQALRATPDMGPSASDPSGTAGLVEARLTGGTLTALVAAGIEESEALEIKRRMDALDLEMMNLQYAAEQDGWTGTERFGDAFRENQAQRDALRETVGDDTYDRYLYAMGQPNRIAIQDVLDGSSAQRAGLQPGDLLLSYAGERLFTVDELIEQSRSGGPGETVTLEVVRDGRPMQVYMPRGPLGIRSGFYRVPPEDTSF